MCVCTFVCGTRHVLCGVCVGCCVICVCLGGCVCLLCKKILQQSLQLSCSCMSTVAIPFRVRELAGDGSFSFKHSSVRACKCTYIVWVVKLRKRSPQIVHVNATRAVCPSSRHVCFDKAACPVSVCRVWPSMYVLRRHRNCARQHSNDAQSACNLNLTMSLMGYAKPLQPKSSPPNEQRFPPQANLL